jgi:glycosyltransferase involved in cell wall biosynthesis
MVVLNSLIDDLEARDIVKLAGNIADVDEYYKSSEIFAFTSSSEGFPNAIGEAMSAGLPVVAFDCIAGPSDMVTDGVDGYLVPVFDYDIFKQKLMLLMSEEDLRKKMGNAAAVNIQKYSADHVCKKYYDLLVTKAL